MARGVLRTTRDSGRRCALSTCSAGFSLLENGLSDFAEPLLANHA